MKVWYCVDADEIYIVDRGRFLVSDEGTTFFTNSLEDSTIINLNNVFKEAANMVYLGPL